MAKRNNDKNKVQAIKSKSGSNPKKKTNKVSVNTKKSVRSNKKRAIPLRKYQKVVSLIVKDNKKKGIEYNIADVRKVASTVYPAIKELPLSKIGIRKVQSVEKEITEIVKEEIEPQEDSFRIGSENIPSWWFDDVFNFWEIGEHIVKFSNTYPEVPIVIKSNGNELSIVGSMGSYEGSEAQAFVEDLRSEMETQDSTSSDYQQFYGTPTKGYAFWGSEGVEFPETLDFVQAKGVVMEEIEIREENFQEQEIEEKKLKRERKKKEKQPLPKKPKSKPQLKKPTPKKVTKTVAKKVTKKAPIKKLQPTKEVQGKTTLAEKNKAIELLLKQFELGLIDKDEFRSEKKSIMSMYEKGGSI